MRCSHAPPGAACRPSPTARFAPSVVSCPGLRPARAWRVCRARLQADSQTEEERISAVRAEVTKRIKALGAAGRVREAITALAGLANVGVQPDTRAATALVQACCRDMQLAQSIFDEMFGEFLTPDEVTFAVLLRGYGALTPPDWRSIDTTLTTMRMKFGMTPTAVSFNALLEICARTSDLDRGQDIIDRMAADGVAPDEFTEDIVAKRKALRSYLKKTLL